MYFAERTRYYSAPTNRHICAARLTSHQSHARGKRQRGKDNRWVEKKNDEARAATDLSLVHSTRFVVHRLFYNPLREDSVVNVFVFVTRRRERESVVYRDYSILLNCSSTFYAIFAPQASWEVPEYSKVYLYWSRAYLYNIS